MNIVEMYELCKEIYKDNLDKYEYIGLRFEDKVRTIGETCEYSRHNPNREDERDFPQYGTDEYFETEELDGTSAWDMSEDSIYRIESWRNKEEDCWNHFLQQHCYIIAGNVKGSHDYPDPNEILIGDAVVIAQIF
jgi:hypothetical protein